MTNDTFDREGYKMRRVYGYCRVSTKKQMIERQERNIKEVYPEAFIIKEAYTGTKVEGRKEFLKMKSLGTTYSNNGDEVVMVFDSVSRMSRNAEEGYNLYKELYDSGIELVFLKEPQINTSTYKEAMDRKIKMDIDSGDEATNEFMKAMNDAINMYMMRLVERQIKLAFERSEAEVKDLQQRTKEGIKTVILNGGKVGNDKGVKLTTKKSVVAKEQIKKYSKDFEGSLNDKDTIKIIGIAPNTYYKYKKEMRQAMA